MEAMMTLAKNDTPKMVIMDDLQHVMTEKNGRETVLSMLHRLSHHGNISFVFLVQNFCHNSMPDVRKQCSEIVVMTTGPTVKANVRRVGNDMGMSTKFLEDCIDKVIETTSHGHLLISTGADAGLLNVRSGITPGDPTQTFFVPKGKLTTREFVRVKRHGEKEEAERERAGREGGEGWEEQEEVGPGASGPVRDS
jgi:hypothetical protein